jgi:hypothetical protein
MGENNKHMVAKLYGHIPVRVHVNHIRVISTYIVQGGRLTSMLYCGYYFTHSNI